MSPLPGHDRAAQDDARQDARDNERNTQPFAGAPTTATGRDLLAELAESIKRARERQGRP